jgi:hypothetical protein
VPLNSTQVKTLKAGAHADGGGLYLHVREGGERLWAFRFTAPDGKPPVMEFAKVSDLGLSDVRDQARESARKLKRRRDTPGCPVPPDRARGPKLPMRGVTLGCVKAQPLLTNRQTSRMAVAARPGAQVPARVFS